MSKTSTRIFFVYIVRCRDGTLYTGMSNDVQKRIAKHNAGTGAKYTRSRKPVLLLYLKPFQTKALAASEERRIKKLTKKEKEALCLSP
jgi:putative endonuclease